MKGNIYLGQVLLQAVYTGSDMKKEKPPKAFTEYCGVDKHMFYLGLCEIRD